MKELSKEDYSNKVETISSEYDEYRSELLNLYHRTTIDNSVVSAFLINGNVWSHSLSVIDKQNNQRIIKKKEFKYSNGFINDFIIPMVEEYKKENFICDSNVEILDENCANVAIKTKLNDKLIFLGISVEIANKINDLIKKNEKEEIENINQRGIINSLAIGFLLIVMVSIMTILIFIIKK